MTEIIPLHPRRALDVFVGRWTVEGQSFAAGQDPSDPRAGAVRWVGEESYEWLPGGAFMLHRWDAMVGTFAFKGVMVLGHDPGEEGGCYFSHLYDNGGAHAAYRVTTDGDRWTFSEPATRATIALLDGGQRMHVVWDWKNGGPDWLPLCDRVSRRAG